MTQQTYKALAIIKTENMDYSLWDIIPSGCTAWRYTMREADEIVDLPAHVAIWFTEDMYEGDVLDFLKTAPYRLALGTQEDVFNGTLSEYVAIFPFEIDE